MVERLIELETPEKGGSSILRNAERTGQPEQAVFVEQSVEPPQPPSPSIESEQPKPAKPYQGTLQTRQLLERLQSALAGGTPLQEYQIRALIAALDEVYEETQRNSMQGAGARHGSQDGARDAAINERIVQVADDVLFESQLEQLMLLLEQELDAKKVDQ